MIDTLRRVGLKLRILRVPAILVGSICLAAIVGVLLTSTSHAGDRLLMPAFVGLLWATSVWTFIEIFSAVPERAGSELGLYGKLKRHVHRAWFWVLGLVLAVAIGTALLLTGRLVTIWLREYGA
jgi:hypothetical protein